MREDYPKLTEGQAAFLQKLLPPGYSFQPVQIEEKRNRIKKVDDSYLMEYFTSPRPQKIAEKEKNANDALPSPTKHNSIKSLTQ
jgi:hypothetical protein